MLAFDPLGQGERLQYLDPGQNQSLDGPTGEHGRFGWPARLIGSSTTQSEGWDGIRRLDHLLSRPEIDREKDQMLWPFRWRRENHVSMRTRTSHQSVGSSGRAHGESRRGQ